MMKIRSLFLVALVGCSAESSLVGARCGEGFSPSQGACVGSADDVVTSSPDPTSPRFPDGIASTQSVPSSGSGDAFGGAGGGAGSATPGTSPGTAPGSTPGAKPDAGSSPALVCDGPLVACHGECISVSQDAANCGACGKICPSNICVDGECQGALAGDVIVVGHEYDSPATSSAQAKLIANALAIATTDPIRVLAFDGDRVDSSADRALIASSVRFRDVSYTTAANDGLEATDLAKHYDVVLVFDAGGSASYLGARARGALETFTKRGGIVVAVDDGASDMPAFLRDSGLLAMDSHTLLATDTQILVAAPNDALGVQVLSPYAASGATVGFLGVQKSPDVTIVAHTNDDAAHPTAIHRFVR